MKLTCSFITGCVLLTLLLLALSAPTMAEPNNFVTAQVSSLITSGEPLIVSGSVWGTTIPKSVQIWFFDTDYATMTETVVKPDKTFFAKIPTDGIRNTKYYVIVDNPGDDLKFALTMNNTIGDVLITATGSKLFSFKGANALQGTEAATAITTALTLQGVDDVYYQTTLDISDPLLFFKPSNINGRAGEPQNIDIVLSSAGNGISKYGVSASLDQFVIMIFPPFPVPPKPKIIGVTFPSWANGSSTISTSGYSVYLSAVDAGDQIRQNATNVTLATITVASNQYSWASLNLGLTSNILYVLDESGASIPIRKYSGSIVIGKELPHITWLDPMTTRACLGDLNLTINGGGFTRNSTLLVDSRISVNSTYISPTRLNAIIPGELISPYGYRSGTREITVMDPSTGTFLYSNNATLWIYDPPAPSINKIIPQSVVAGQNELNITVKGFNFIKGSTVQIDEKDLSTKYKSSMTLSAQVPSEWLATSGLKAIRVMTPITSGPLYSNSLTLRVKSVPPIIDAINPQNVRAGGGKFALTIPGGHFVAGSKVQWNGKNLPTTYLYSTALRASISRELIRSPKNATIRAINPGVNGGSSNGVILKIL